MESVILSVSVLIPAFRPTYLRQALASALAQGGDDYEIVVSDDSGGDAVLAVVETFRDPRIRYLRTSGKTGAGPNCRNLWANCRTERMLFLFDDDVLMPYALAELGGALDQYPEASFAYGRRYKIDEQGRIIQGVAPDSAPQLVGSALFRETLIENVRNFVGELSSVMINLTRDIVVEDLLYYQNNEMHVTADVALYLNAACKGAVAAVCRPVAAFRQHPAQNSSPEFNPKFAIGIVEWELFIRGEFSAGRIPKEKMLSAVDKLNRGYATWVQTQPSIAMMAPGASELRARVEAGETDLLDPEFRAAWDGFIETVLTAARGHQPAPAIT